MTSHQTSESAARSNPVILIVDDEPIGRQAIASLLVGQDYALAFAETGAEALEQAARLLPDLILLDVMLPGIDGFQVCRNLRADPTLAQVPVVMVTALDDQESRVQGIESGADDFVSKPFNRAELRARVRTITRLNRYRSLLNERQALRDLTHQMIELQERDRQLVSVELYQEVVEGLSGLKQLLRQTLERAPQTKLELDTALATIDDLLAHVRNLSLDLRPRMLDDFGLYPALTWLVNLAADQTGLTINRNFTEQNDTRYARAVETAIFRIAQEALANIIHHAQATEVQITLEEKEGRLSFQARDNGTGFDLKNLEMRRGHLTGISSMQERARQAGGSLTIESAPSRNGTLVTAVFPLTLEKN